MKGRWGEQQYLTYNMLDIIEVDKYLEKLSSMKHS